MREPGSVRLSWSFARGPVSGGVGGRVPGLRPVRAAFSSRAHFLFVLGLLPRVALRRPRLKFRLGRDDHRQAVFATGQLLRHAHPLRHLGRVGRLAQRHQRRHLGPQPGFDLAGALPRQRTVPARVGVDLRAVQRHRAQLQHAGLARQQQNIHEQLLDLGEKAPAEGRAGVMVAMIVRRDEAEGHRVVGRPFQLAARIHFPRIAMDQQPQQHARMMRRRARTAISLDEGREVQLIDHLDDKASQVSLREPLVHRRRQQIPRLSVHLSKVVHHQIRHAGENQTMKGNPIFAFGSSPTG